MKGYRKDPGHTAESTPDGWLHRDVFDIDLTAIQAVDRKKELIITAAEKHVAGQHRATPSWPRAPWSG